MLIVSMRMGMEMEMKMKMEMERRRGERLGGEVDWVCRLD